MYKITQLLRSTALLALLAVSACGGSSNQYAGTGAPAAVTPGSATPASTTTGFTISGVVSGDAGASVTASGAAASSVGTDSAGNFSIASIGAGSYTVTPTHTGIIFTPVSRAETVTTTSITDVNFAATTNTSVTYTLSGTVSGSTMAGVTMTLNGVNVGAAVTDLSGNYTFAGLTSGTYTISASLDGYTFTAPLIVAITNTDSTGNNFTSSAKAGDSLAFTAITTLPNAAVGVAYSSTVVNAVTGGTAPYHYHSGLLDDGTPPLGMIVNPNGKLTGTPTAPGLYEFTVCAVDAAGATSPCAPTSLTVEPASGVTPVGTPTSAATVTLSASPATTTAGSAATLKWSSAYATSCAASGGWTGNKSTSGSATVSPKSTTTYSLTCAGPGGAGKASVVVTVKSTTPVAPPAGTPAPTVNLSASAGTITAGNSSKLTWSSTNADSCTASGGWSGAKGDSGTGSVSPTATTTYTLSCSGAGGTMTDSATVTVNAATQTPPASGTSWVYYNGTFDWPGDFNFAASGNYKDTSGGPLSGAYDIKMTSSAYGGWLPYAQNWDFNSAPYTKLTFSLKPTRSGQVWQVYFVKIHDVPVGISQDVSRYGPTPVAGQWATYTVPLKDLGVLGTSIYKFAIQDQTGANGNVWYIDNVGFVP